mmetsp:Transcript_43572/g.94929  ORF Transcript_43572/g.94929 Transcript_43572/m.94929 type:complete len:291 (-) Transcript_43572:33-905(-)
MLCYASWGDGAKAVACRGKAWQTSCSVHPGDELVDEVLAGSPLAALLLGEAVALGLLEATLRRRELEGPEEVGRLLEVRAHRVDLVDEILHAVDAVLGQVLRDHSVVRERDALLVDLAEATLVDELLHRLQRGIAIGHVGLDALQHLQDRLVHLQEDAIVQLLQAEQLQNLARLRAQLDDTHDPRHKDELRLRLHEEVASSLRLATQGDELALVRRVLLVVLQRAHLQVVALLRALLLLRRRGLLLLVSEKRVTRKLQLHGLRHSRALRDGVLGDEVALRHCNTSVSLPG